MFECGRTKPVEYHTLSKIRFLVACTRLYKSLCRSVRPSRCAFLWVLVSFHEFSQVFTSFHKFSQVFTSFHKFSQVRVLISFQKFSQVFTSFHKFSQVFTVFHKFSQVFTSFHIFSKESTRLMAMALFIPIRCMMRFHSQTTFIRVIFVSSSIWGGQVEGNKYVTAVSS